MSECIQVFDPLQINTSTTTLFPRWVPGELQWKLNDPVTPEVVDKVRGDLAIETIATASEKRLRAIVIDGGSSRPFCEALALYRDNVQISKETGKGISPSRQQGFKEAQTKFGGLANLWTEPEKISIVRDCLEPLMSPILQNQADLTIPSRDDESFATFPEYQSYIAQEANRQWNEVVREAGLLPQGCNGYDVFFGPFGWRKDITGLFLRRYSSKDRRIKPEVYCNANYFPIVAALEAGKRVVSVPVPYRHSELQKAIENYNPVYKKIRDHQLKIILEATKEYIALIHGEPSNLALVN